MLEGFNIFFDMLNLIMGNIKCVLDNILIGMEFVFVDFRLTKFLVMIILYKRVKFSNEGKRLVISHYTCVFEFKFLTPVYNDLLTFYFILVC